MSISTVTSKGQITLPLDVRRALGLDAGDKVDFVAVEDGFKLVALRRDVRALKGRFAGRVTEAVTIEQMDDLAERGACGFADAVIVAAALKAGCTTIMSFDRGAVRAGMSLLD